jgi:DNA-binding NarL/FixJ family response regulator
MSGPLKGCVVNINILLVDDHKLMREGLRTLIAEQPDMKVIAEAEDGASAVQLAARLSPDIIIMDISMPGLNGIEATRQILSANPISKVIALSMHLECRIVLEMLHAGASGYLLKECAFDEVIRAVATVASNRAYLSPKITDIVLKDPVLRNPENEASSVFDLTLREREVMQFLNAGRSTGEIASLLHVSVKTVETHQQHIIFNHVVPNLHRAKADKKTDQSVSLTCREKELLLWAKEGKGTWEMSLILGISRDTVKYHLKNIYQKLNASNRSQAIVAAIENKLIDA